MVEHEPFCLKQYSPRLARRVRLALFGDPGTATLRVDARAARKEHLRSRKSIEKIARAVEVDMAISIGVTAARADALDYRVKRYIARSNPSSIRDIDRADQIRHSG